MINQIHAELEDVFHLMMGIDVTVHVVLVKLDSMKKSPVKVSVVLLL